MISKTKPKEVDEDARHIDTKIGGATQTNKTTDLTAQ